MKKQPKQKDLVGIDFDAALKAMLKTPPPPADKKAPAKKAKAKK